MTTCDDLARTYPFAWIMHACVMCVCAVCMRSSVYRIIMYFIKLSLAYVCALVAGASHYVLQIHSMIGSGARAAVAILDESLKLSLAECTMAIVLANTLSNRYNDCARGSSYSIAAPLLIQSIRM